VDDSLIRQARVGQLPAQAADNSGPHFELLITNLDVPLERPDALGER
jgi:hypothetical protein